MAGDEDTIFNPPPPPPPKPSPYTLHPSDSPGLVLTKVQLKGASNYFEWADEILYAFAAKRKDGFLDGTITKPSPDHSDFSEWKPVNAMLQSWIKQTLSPDIHIGFMSSAQALWAELQRRYAVTNPLRLHQLRDTIRSTQQAGLSVAAYYGQLKNLYDELGGYLESPDCTCGLCTCHNAARVVRKERETEMLGTFLMGLDRATYEITRSNILSRTPLPDIGDAYNIVCQEESHRAVGRAKEAASEAVGFTAQAPPVPSSATPISTSSFEPRTRPSKPVCSYCKKEGHDVQNCYQIIGYPDRDTNDRGQNYSRGRGRGGRGSSRGGRGRSRGQFAQAHAAYVDSSSTSHASDRAPLPTLSAEQWDSLLNYLSTHKPTSSDKLVGESLLSLWIMDTGASCHMTGQRSYLSNIVAIPPIPVRLPNGFVSHAKYIGAADLGDGFILQRVLLVPHLTCNLLSITAILDDVNGYFVSNNKFCVIQDRTLTKLIGVGERSGGVYVLRGLLPVRSAQANLVTKASSSTSSLVLWHRRMGHPSSRVVSLLPIGISGDSLKNCDICLRAKKTRDVFLSSDSHATEPFEIIHIDVWGAYRQVSTCGAYYFLTIVDDFSRHVWVYLLSCKSAVPDRFKKFMAMAKTQFSKGVKVVRTDNGTEFLKLKPFFDSIGVLFQHSCIGTPQQNGRVERKHRHILNVARSLKFQGDLPTTYWGEFILTAAYLINRTPTPLNDGKTPYEVLYGKIPAYKHIRVFGCLCYAYNMSRDKDKFQERGRRCVFLGYPVGVKGWRVCDLETGTLFNSRDVTFVEDQFPYSDPSTLPRPFNTPTQPLYFDDDESPVGSHPSPSQSSPPRLDVATSSSTTPPSSPAAGRDSPARGSSNVDPDARALLLGRGHRVKLPNVRLRGYSGYMCTAIPNIDPRSTSTASSASASSGTPYPLASFVTYDKFSVGHRALLAAVTSSTEPTSYKEAVTHPSWREAMRKEIDALGQNHTWTLEHLPPGKRALPCKWVYRTKFNSDGTIERNKARLVVCGNHQKEGDDYTELFAPVAKMVSVRTFLAVAAARKWELHQMDVHNAFLHGDLHEEVYMRPPPGYQTSNPNLVCRLRKSLYGLRQAPRNWFSKLSTALKAFGFTQSYADYSLFTLHRGATSLCVLVYVDDLVIAGNDTANIARLKNHLSSCFHMKDLGRLKYFLGIEIARSDRGLFLGQRKYALDILQETGLLGAKPAMFPMETNHQLDLAKGPLLSDPSSYRRLVGRLIYITLTRPDLSYPVHVLAQFMQSPRQEHWDAAIRVVRYLKGTPGQGILLSADSNLQLHGFSDSDWGTCRVSRRSLTGYFVMLGQSPISWKTKKQSTVSRSSAEAEYRAMAMTTAELVWLRYLLASLGVLHPQPARLYCDNTAALYIASNPVFHDRTKHIEIDCHYVREKLEAGIIKTAHVRSSEQLADVFTKALGQKQFMYLLGKLGVVNPHAPT